MERHDQILWSDEMIQDRITELAQHRLIPHCEERRQQISRELSILAFESSERFRELKNQEIEEAWGRH